MAKLKYRSNFVSGANVLYNHENTWSGWVVTPKLFPMVVWPQVQSVLLNGIYENVSLPIRFRVRMRVCVCASAIMNIIIKLYRVYDQVSGIFEKFLSGWCLGKMPVLYQKFEFTAYLENYYNDKHKLTWQHNIQDTSLSRGKWLKNDDVWEDEAPLDILSQV